MFRGAAAPGCGLMWTLAEQPRAPVGDFAPAWASAWGDDSSGLWAELAVAGFSQRLRWIEPGRFLMGSTGDERRTLKDKNLRDWADRNEAPQHLVTLSQGFWLADTPCTQGLWLALMGGKNPSQFADGDGAALRPVERVDWDQAVAFLNALRSRLPGADPMLPSDAQWEYACRAGSTTAYAWGDDADKRLANMDGAARQTTPVKQYPPNAWGLYDMHGNVWEWCADGLRDFGDGPEVNPTGGDAGDTRVRRGGSWLNPAGYARSAFRYDDHRGFHWHDSGFRFALRSPSPGGVAAGRQAGV